MAEITEIAQKIMEIDGVTGVVVSTIEGQPVLSREMNDPAELAGAMALCSLNAEALKQVVGLSRVVSVQFLTQSTDEIIFLALNKHIVGIRKTHKAYTDEILRGFRNIFKTS